MLSSLSLEKLRRVTQLLEKLRLDLREITLLPHGRSLGLDLPKELALTFDRKRCRPRGTQRLWEES